MPASNGTHQPLGAASRHFGHLLLTIGENRLELLTVELQEERDRFLQSIVLALAAGAFGLLAGMTLTGAIVVLMWPYAPVAALLVLTALYALAGYVLCRRLLNMLYRPPLAATVDQLRKDRECLAKILT